jgi:tRNA pseudouridine55 synthase
MEGILNVDKPGGMTSHDVVARVRRLTGARRVGHAGTLDPLATGVLVCCVGQATRLAEYLSASDKVYRAVARFGLVTDTYDIEGAVVAEVLDFETPVEEIRAALTGFVGDILQAPPAYSAIKLDGVPAYRRARRGEEVRPLARPVSVHSIELISWSPPYLSLEIACGPGTYVRSLVHDLGAVLGCGAALASLRRTRSGRFRVEDASTLEQLAAAAGAGKLEPVLLPATSALGGLVEVVVDAHAADRLRAGMVIPVAASPSTSVGYAVTATGDLVAILALDELCGVWQPRKVFAPGPTP